MRQVIGQLDKVVDTRVTVLIEGETGTGKELIAARRPLPLAPPRQALRRAELRGDGRETLLESELFGHKKGRIHRRAPRSKQGLFEIADGGTLFLDEITRDAAVAAVEAPPCAAGGRDPPRRRDAARSSVNVRIVAATNREPRGRGGRRAASARTSTTASRSSRSACRRCASAATTSRCVAAHFLERFADRDRQALRRVSASRRWSCIQRYDWPGNVRELQNEVQRLVIQLDAGGVRHTGHALAARSARSRGMIARGADAEGHAQGDDGPGRDAASSSKHCAGTTTTRPPAKSLGSRARAPPEARHAGSDGTRDGESSPGRGTERALQDAGEPSGGCRAGPAGRATNAPCGGHGRLNGEENPGASGFDARPALGFVRPFPAGPAHDTFPKGSFQGLGKSGYEGARRRAGGGCGGFAGGVYAAWRGRRGQEERLCLSLQLARICFEICFSAASPRSSRARPAARRGGVAPQRRSEQRRDARDRVAVMTARCRAAGLAIMRAVPEAAGRSVERRRRRSRPGRCAANQTPAPVCPACR